MKKLILLALALSVPITAGVTINLDAEARQRSICVGFLCKSNNDKVVPGSRFGVISGTNYLVPAKACYMVATSFPIQNLAQLGCLVAEDASVYSGVISQGRRSKLLKEMLGKKDIPDEYNESQIAQELLTIYQIPETKFSQVSITIERNSSGEPFLLVKN
jgi:hypothetical protein